jgi:hypothetical protein
VGRVVGSIVLFVEKDGVRNAKVWELDIELFERAMLEE